MSPVGDPDHVGSPPAASSGAPAPGSPTSLTKDPGELSEEAWIRVTEAMQSGIMFLPNGRQVVLGPKEFVDLVKWLAVIKARRPKAVSKLEDFLPKVTKR